MSHLNNSTYLASTSAPNIPQGWELGKPTVIFIGPNAGGSNKSKTAKHLASVAKAAGHEVMLIDADPGIGSLSASLATGQYAVDEFPIEESATYGATLLAKAKKTGATIIIVDLGANEMMRGPMSRTVKATLETVRAAGCRTFVVLSLIPFKAGLDEDADNFGSRLRRFAKVATFYHGREKGGDFSKIDGLKADFDLSVEVPADELAIVGIVADRQLLPLDFARAPEPGFILASAWVARNLLAFAQQDGVRIMVGSDAASEELTYLAKGAPLRNYRGRTNIWEVHDDALNADSAALVAEDNLMSITGKAGDATIAAAARTFVAAIRHRRNVAATLRTKYAG